VEQQHLKPRIAEPGHECSVDQCRYVEYENVFICKDTGNYHECTAIKCDAIVETNDFAFCTKTGISYDLALVTPMDRDLVDFSNQVSTMPKQPKRPGPRPKEPTSSRDTENLRRVAINVVQNLLQNSGQRVSSCTAPYPQQKQQQQQRHKTSPTSQEGKKKKPKQQVATRRYRPPETQQVNSTELTAEFKRRFSETCIVSWNYISSRPNFAQYRNKYKYENHCLVVIYYSRLPEGFECEGFRIPYEDILHRGIVNRSALGRIFGQGRVYTSAVKRFLAFVQPTSVHSSALTQFLSCSSPPPSSPVATSLTTAAATSTSGPFIPTTPATATAAVPMVTA